MGQTGRAVRAYQVAHSVVRLLLAASVRTWKIATLAAVAALLSLTSQSASAAELIVNGNFEAGTSLSATGWTQVPSTSFNYVIRASAAESGSPYFCCSNNATGFGVPINDSFSLLLTQTGTSSGYAFQTITVPAGATGTISFNYRAYVQGTSGTGNQDRVKVDIVTPGTEGGDTSVLATLLSFGPATPFQSGTVSTSLAPFAGQTISIRAFAYGFSFPANLAIDNVSAFVNNPPALSITKSHSGTFTQGGTAAWTIQVGNTGTGPTDGSTVTVSDTLPAGYTLASFSGAGWSCSGTTTVTCTTNAVVAASGSFNLLTLNVNVPANSPTSVGNAASVFGGGDTVHTNAGNALSSNTDTVIVAQVAASMVVNGGSSQSTTILSAFATPLSAIVRDAANAPVQGVNVTFTAPVSGASGEFLNLTNTITVATNASGIATAPISANATAGGPYLVSATAGALSTSFSLTNTVGAPASISVSGGNNQSATILTAFATPLSVVVRDVGLNPVPNANVVFTAPASGASAVFSNSTNTITVATDSSGVATAPATANATAGGPYSVSAQVGAFSTSFSLTNSVGAPASIAINGGNNQSVTILTSFGTALSVLIRDAGNNPVPNTNVVFTAPGSGASGVFSNSTNTITVSTNASGIASAPVSANATAGGPYSVSAQAGALSASFSLTNLVGAPASIAVNGGNNQSTVITTPFATAMSAIVRDAGNNLVSGATVTFTAPSSGASGKFPGNVLTANAVTNGSGIATAPTFTANATAGGPYNVSATVGSFSTVFAMTNTQAATTTTVSSSSASVLLGQPVTLTALVTPAVAPGTVTFNDGVTPLCSTVALVTGTATCSTSFATGGAHAITARYNGSASYLTSTSPAITITVTDQRFRTVEAIGNFLSLRNDMLLNHEPDAGRQIDRLLQVQGGAEGAGGGSGFAPTAAQRGFSAGGNSGLDNTALGSFAGAMGMRETGGPSSLERAANRAGLSAWSDEAVPASFYPQAGSLRGFADGTGAIDVSFATSLNQILRTAAGSGGTKLGANETDVGGSRFDIWLQGEYATFGDDRLASDSSGHFGVVYFGADYVMRPWLLVGGLIQYDEMKQTSTVAGYETQGAGWMVGPYATVRLSPALFLQARAAWGWSSNDVSPFLTYTDSFDSTRWLISSSLTGNWSDGAWRFRPSASFAYVEDVSDSYFDHFGVLIPSVSTSLGQFKASPEVSYVHVDKSGTRIEPRLTASAIWNFKSSESAASFGGTLVGPEELRGKIEAGLGIHFYNGITVDISGSYDGIGSDTYDATGVSAGVRIPLN